MVETKEKVTVMNTAPDGSQIMSDGTVRVPEKDMVVKGDPNKRDTNAMAVPQPEGLYRSEEEAKIVDPAKAAEAAKEQDGAVKVDDLHKVDAGKK